MKTIALLLPLALLAACNEQAAPVPEPTGAVEALPTEGLSAPGREAFADAFAEACPDAEPVSTALCKRAGMGSPDMICDYGLGEDEYRRNTAVMTARDGAWVIADPAAVCSEPETESNS